MILGKTRAAVVPLIVLLLALYTACDSGRFDVDLPGTVSTLRERYDYPAMAGAYITSLSIETYAEGTRKLGADNPVTLEDRWHIGSNTKAMTATIIAKYIEQGLLSWQTTPLDVFPELAGSMDTAYHYVTMHDLLTHRSGMQAFTVSDEYLAVPSFSGTASQQRHAFADWILARPPAVPRGTYVYSNAAYAVAGAMIETVTNTPYETLIEEQLCAPLGLHAYFGWPARSDSNQPWGHWTESGTLAPHDPHDEYQLPAYLTPAGDISMSIGDYGRFVQMHLRALRDQPELLSAASFEFLHDPVGDYACGWVVTTLNGIAFEGHEGSAGTFEAFVGLEPTKDRGMVLFINAADDQSGDAIDAAILDLGFARR